LDSEANQLLLYFYNAVMNVSYYPVKATVKVLFLHLFCLLLV